MGEMYARREMEFTEARQRMARMPVGSKHIANPVSTAPGFNIGNVYVMAGVPQVFQLLVDGEKLARHCRVIWTDGKKLGVSFM